MKLLDACKNLILIGSRPAGARGLKRQEIQTQLGKEIVAPRRGAWIETGAFVGSRVPRSPSRPAGARGLKQIGLEYNRRIICRAPQGRVD